MALGFDVGPQPAADLEWKKSLIDIFERIDRRETCRFILQDTAGGKEATRGILIDILGPPLTPPSSSVSYSRQKESSTPQIPGALVMS